MSPAKKKQRDPDATVHLHVKPGRTVVLADGCSYGDRATLQVPGRVADKLLRVGNVEEVDPAAVPDVAPLRALMVLIRGGAGPPAGTLDAVLPKIPALPAGPSQPD